MTTTASSHLTTLSPTFARHLKAHLFGWSAARLRIIYDALYKSTHHHHHHLLSLYLSSTRSNSRRNKAQRSKISKKVACVTDNVQADRTFTQRSTARQYYWIFLLWVPMITFASRRLPSLYLSSACSNFRRNTAERSQSVRSLPVSQTKCKRTERSHNCLIPSSVHRCWSSLAAGRQATPAHLFPHHIDPHLKTVTTRMWANAQRDGHPAKYRWRPLFNTAKFGWHPLPECRAVTLPRHESRWN